MITKYENISQEIKNLADNGKIIFDQNTNEILPIEDKWFKLKNERLDFEYNKLNYDLLETDTNLNSTYNSYLEVLEKASDIWVNEIETRYFDQTGENYDWVGYMNQEGGKRIRIINKKLIYRFN